MKYIIVLNICLGLLFGCGDNGLMKQIESYRGDGAIRFLDSPGPLGRSGVAISMSPFDLSAKFSTNYNITGIPKGDAYLIYLVLNEANSIDQLSTGVLSYNLTKNGNVVSKQSSKIRDLIKTAAGEEILFYFYKKNMGPAYFDVDDPTAKWAFSVSYENANNIDSNKAFFLIKTGGSK
jgi:hypothetical protein